MGEWKLGAAARRTLEEATTGMTQMAKFAELRQAWGEKGNPPCDHPDVDREHYLGSDTGDEGCLVCGDTWDRGSVRREGRPIRE